MRYNTKVKLLIVLTILLLIVVAIAVSLGITDKPGEEGTEPTEMNIQTTAPQTEPFLTQPPQTILPTETPTEVPTEEPTEEPAELPTEAPTEAPTEPPKKKPSQGSNGNKGDTSTSDKPAAPKETEPPALKFPYSVPGTSLVIDQVNSYDGIFLEDGSDKEVNGISVIVLKNTGNIGVEYANITLKQGGKELHYEATAIPAGATVVVQEASAAAYKSANYEECMADVALLEKFEMSSSLIKIEENEDGSMSITNLGDETIPCVRVFYKFAMETGKIYVGGITYNAKVIDLEPGAPQQITPSHYAPGSSEIMMVRTYATAD